MTPGTVYIYYTDWKGVSAWRAVVPKCGGIYFGSNEWHKKPQWLLDAFDVEKQEWRTFAFADIRQWMPWNSTLAALLGEQVSDQPYEQATQ